MTKATKNRYTTFRLVDHANGFLGLPEPRLLSARTTRPWLQCRQNGIIDDHDK